MKAKKSGPAIFMYAVIGFTAAASLICFIIHYIFLSSRRRAELHTV